MMSPKQAIYQSILSWSLPYIRNGLSNTVHVPWWTLLPRRRRRFARSHYEVAQLVHSLSGTIFCEEFTDQDLWFLNVPARTFLERNSPQTLPLYPVFALRIQQLFAAVPDTLKHQLEWAGPTGDWSWAILNQDEKQQMIERLFPQQSAGGTTGSA